METFTKLIEKGEVTLKNDLKELKLSEKEKENLENLGIYGFAYIDFDMVMGPKLKFYYAGSKARFISKLVNNPAIAVELSIIGKYAQEVVTDDRERLLIQKIDIEGKDGRSYPHFLVLEIKGNRKRAARMVAKKIAKNGLSNLKSNLKIVY